MSFRRVTEFSGGNWKKQPDGSWENSVFAYYISLSCNHCEDPACVKVCPTKAHHKDPQTGLVLIDATKCIGCGMCATVCPYSAPKLDTVNKKMRKCNACLDLISKGGNPACVEAFPQRVLEFGEIEVLRKKHGTLAQVAPMPTADKTKPCIVIKPSKNVKAPGEVGEIHWPIKS